ncbi:hypothetical protein Q3G72_018353 [Acer saccharum]|nr:hypothetical protein Q3G72_018353 [Acer saccharum]
MLKAEKYALEEMVKDLSNKNHKLRKINKTLTVKNESTVQELEDLAKLTEEFEDEASRKLRKAQMSTEAKNKELEVIIKEMSKKEVALKIAKVKECDYLVEIDRMEQVIKTLTDDCHSKPKVLMQKGRIPLSSLSCYFCHKKGHVKSREICKLKPKSTRLNSQSKVAVASEGDLRSWCCAIEPADEA